MWLRALRFSCGLFASFSPWDLDFYLYLRYFYGTSYARTLLLTMFSRSRRPSAEYGRSIDEISRVQGRFQALITNKIIVKKLARVPDILCRKRNRKILYVLGRGQGLYDDSKAQFSMKSQNAKSKSSCQPVPDVQIVEQGRKNMTRIKMGENRFFLLIFPAYDLTFSPPFEHCALLS